MWPFSRTVCARRQSAFAALGLALCDQGNYDAAIAPLSKSLQWDPADVWETRWAPMSQEALARSNGKAPAVALLVAQSLTAVGRFEDATQMLREFLRDHASTEEAATASRWLEQLATNGKIRSNGSAIDCNIPKCPRA